MQGNEEKISGRKMAHQQIGGVSIIVVIFLVVILGSIFVLAFPVYPRITVTFSTQTSTPRFYLGGVTQDRLTLFQAASIQKGQIFLYPISTTQSSYYVTFTLYVVILDRAGHTLDQNSWPNEQLGTYSFVVIPELQFAQNVTYSFQMTATFSDGPSIIITGTTPPS